MLSFGAIGRKVVIDPKSKIVRTNSRIFWFFRRLRRIEFDWVSEVFYCYNDLGGNSWNSHYEQDLYSVGIKLKDGSIVTFFRFFGEGEFSNASFWPE